jgi:hypothetical protein
MTPEQSLRERLQSANETTAYACQIKGNINRNGERIYHVPVQGIMGRPG